MEKETDPKQWEEEFQQMARELANKELGRLEQATPEELLEYIAEMGAHVNLAYKHMVVLATISRNAVEKIEQLELEVQRLKEQTGDVIMRPVAGVVGVS